MEWRQGPLTADQTEAWFSRYQRESKLYSWGFFVLLHPIVFGIIWWSMGELNRDVFLSLGFFSTVTFILAILSRSRTSRAWSGVVADKRIQQRRVWGGANADERIEYRYEVVVETSRQRKLTLSCLPAFFEYVNEGDVLVKAPGFDWPEKAELDHDRRVCIACGGILDPADGNCPRCGAPMPDHASLVRVCAIDGASGFMK
jgi:hypothetical protein